MSPNDVARGDLRLSPDIARDDSPMPWTHQNQAIVTFLDFGVRDIGPQVRALRLHSIKLAIIRSGSTSIGIVDF